MDDADLSLFARGSLQAVRHLQPEFGVRDPRPELSILSTDLHSRILERPTQFWTQRGDRSVLDVGALALLHLHRQRLCLGNVPQCSIARDSFSLDAQAEREPWQMELAWLRIALGFLGADECIDPRRLPFSCRLGALS